MKKLEAEEDLTGKARVLTKNMKSGTSASHFFRRSRDFKLFAFIYRGFLGLENCRKSTVFTSFPKIITEIRTQTQKTDQVLRRRSQDC